MKLVEYELCKMCIIMKNIEDNGSNLQTHYFKRISDLPSRMLKSENHWISRKCLKNINWHKAALLSREHF